MFALEIGCQLVLAKSQGNKRYENLMVDVE